MEKLQQALNLLLDIEVKGENVLKLAQALQLVDNAISELKTCSEKSIEE